MYKSELIDGGKTEYITKSRIMRLNTDFYDFVAEKFVYKDRFEEPFEAIFVPENDMTLTAKIELHVQLYFLEKRPQPPDCTSYIADVQVTWADVHTYVGENLIEVKNDFSEVEMRLHILTELGVEPMPKN